MNSLLLPLKTLREWELNKENSDCIQGEKGRKRAESQYTKRHVETELFSQILSAINMYTEC